MVLRTINPFDSYSLTIHASSPSGQAGDAIINNSDTPNGTVFEFEDADGRIEVVIDDQGGRSDVMEDDKPWAHTVHDGGGLIANGTEVEAESIMCLQKVDEFGNPLGDPFNVTVFSKNGDYGDIWGFSTSEVMENGALYEKISGSNYGSSRYVDLTCFCAGTQVETQAGPVPVERLRVGDMVRVLAGGFRPLRMVLARRIDMAELLFQPRLHPVRITAGSMGQGLPHRDLLVSRQHRMLVASQVAQRMFGVPQVLVAAAKLTALPGIVFDIPIASLTYVHLIFDRHELICAEGCPSESLYLGMQAVETLQPEARAELQAIFPGILSGALRQDPARLIPGGRLQKRLIMRHAANRKPPLASGGAFQVP